MKTWIVKLLWYLLVNKSIVGTAALPLLVLNLKRVHQGGVSHVHLWEGTQHHHFTIPVPEFDNDESQEHHGQPERHTATQGPGAVVAPMAGRVVKIFAANGATVKKGDSILVLEAMKMEVKRTSCITFFY